MSYLSVQNETMSKDDFSRGMFNNYKPNPWFLSGSPLVGKRVLLIGDFRRPEIEGMEELTAKLYVASRDISDTLDFKYQLPSIDLVVINNLVGASKNLGLLEQFISVSTNYDILLLEQNFTNIKKPIEFIKNFYRLFFDKKRRKVLKTLRQHSMVVNHYLTFLFSGRPGELFLPGKYYSNKNSFVINEKVKKILLNTGLGRLFIDSYITLGFIKSSIPKMTKATIKDSIILIKS